MQDGDDRRQLAVLGEDLAGDRLDRHRLACSGVDEADFADAALVGADEHAGNEGGELRIVGLHPPQLGRARPRASREQPFGRRVHQ